MPRPGVRLPPQCQADHQRPLPQLPQEDGAAGRGEKQLFACVCGYREKLSDFKKRRAQKSAGKGDVRRYLAQQEQREEKGSSALAEQLAKWMAQQKGD